METYDIYFACLAWVFLQKADPPINEKHALQEFFRDYLRRHAPLVWSLPPTAKICCSGNHVYITAIVVLRFSVRRRVRS